MQGLMMDTPLLISAVIDYAAAVHGETRITSRTVEGDIHRYTYRAAHQRIQQLAHALKNLGINTADRVATLAWNSHRHFELYYGISGIGAVCHTINPRLFTEQIVYIINHAEDRYICVDLSFVPLLEQIAGRLPRVEGYIILTDRAHMPVTSLPNVLCYEELLQDQPQQFDWPVFDERTACSLCYTSGTTGNPKGVLYSHRSSLLHSLTLLTTGDRSLGPDTVMLPVVPLFHVNAWGLPYALPVVGGSFVFPGPKLDGASLYEMIEQEGVTHAWGVPTVWLGLLQEVKRRQARFSTLRSMIIGGSAAPRSLIETLENDYGMDVIHGWGMTEMSPVGSTSILSPAMRRLPKKKQHDIKVKQGRALFGVELKIVDAKGQRLPHDGKAFGELLVRGPTITSGYYNDPQANENAFDAEGWFRTGDVSTIDEHGFLQIVDRTKDVIKSGGEWISSIDLENAAMGHPGVAEAAVIGVPHPKWGERPLLVVMRTSPQAVNAEQLHEYLSDKVAKWWLPDAIEFVEELPHTATGKLLKTELRKRYKDYQLPTLEN
ncbi:MAG: long-chain-fatty-acid--CoA ligase [Gammaproteobacteria bacterium]